MQALAETSATNIIATSIAGLLIVYLALPKKVRVPTNTIGKAPYPPRVPYRIPFLGSALELPKNGILNFIRQESCKLEGNPPIITTLVAGKVMHFIAHPAAFASCFRYSEKYLSMQPAITDFSRSFFGMSSAGTRAMDRPGLKAVMDHLLKPDGLKQVMDSMQDSIQRHLQEDDFSNCDLNDFVHKIMFRATLESVISKSLSHQEFIDTYFEFESAMMIAFAGLPMKIFAPSAYRAREQIAKWMQDSKFEATPHLKSRRKLLQSRAMSLDDVARDNMLWTWGSVSNFLPSLFWFVYYVSTDPNARTAIQSEVDQVMSQRDGFLTMEQIDRMSSLESMLKESLRLTEHFMITREVMQDMEIDLRLQRKNATNQPSKYFFKKGDNVVLFTPTLHHDPNVYPNPTQFQWDRFVNLSTPISLPDGESVTDPFKAFGGGAHYCPGRKFAVQGAKAFLANLFFRYDVEIRGRTEPDLGRDGLGVLHPRSPVRIQLTRRDRGTSN